MAKIDLKITMHFKGENPDYRELSIEDMDVSLDDIISEILHDNNIKYKAQMENFVSGVTIEKSN